MYQINLTVRDGLYNNIQENVSSVWLVDSCSNVK